MRILITIIALAVLATGALANELTSISAPTKHAKPGRQVAHDPGAPRQGGDTILDAILLDLPAVNVTGTTVGYIDDYDEQCPYTGSTSPDVVYRFAPDHDMGLNIDMLGSAMDTKIYVYGPDFELIACNDDFHPDYTSFLENVPVRGGSKYYLVIDGYGGDSGEYLINTSEFVPCVIDCWAGAQQENEPEIVDGYVDNFNGGCNSVPVVYSPVYNSYYCGKLGYYLNDTGGSSRDLDWHEAYMPNSGVLEIVGDAEEDMNLYEIEGTCDNLVIQNGGVAGPCNEYTVTITGTPGSTVRFLCGPMHFWEGETYEYDYVLLLNVWYKAMNTEEHSWSEVKALFD